MAASTLDVRGGKIVQAIVRDVSGRLEAEQALKEYTRRLEESGALKDLFTDILSHDLLNPVTVIKGMTDILERREHSRDAEELSAIRRNALKIMDIIGSAAAYARIAGVQSFTREKKRIADAVSAAVDRMRGQFERRGMELLLEVESGASAALHPLIETVFDNLLSNCLKYAPEGSTVTVTVGEKAGTAIVSVADEGDGVPEEHREAIFDRFTRREKAGVRGTGLGLAIAKRIVELHYGGIWVEENPGGGSVFRVSLPAE